MITQNESYTVEQAYKQFKSMIHQIIYKMISNVPYHKKSYYEEEMLSLSLSILLPVCKGYNPAVAKFSTYLGNSLYRHLNQWRKRERNREVNRNNFLLQATEEDITTKEDRNRKLKESLSEDALYVCDLMCDPPKSMLEYIPEKSRKFNTFAARRDYKEGAKEYLRSVGWEMWRITRAFREIARHIGTGI